MSARNILCFIVMLCLIVGTVYYVASHRNIDEVTELIEMPVSSEQ